MVLPFSSRYISVISSSYCVSSFRFLFCNYILNFRASSLANAYFSLFLLKLFSRALNFLFWARIGDSLVLPRTCRCWLRFSFSRSSPRSTDPRSFTGVMAGEKPPWPFNLLFCSPLIGGNSATWVLPWCYCATCSLLPRLLAWPMAFSLWFLVLIWPMLHPCCGLLSSYIWDLWDRRFSYGCSGSHSSNTYYLIYLTILGPFLIAGSSPAISEFAWCFALAIPFFSIWSLFSTVGPLCSRSTFLLWLSWLS